MYHALPLRHDPTSKYHVKQQAIIVNGGDEQNPWKLPSRVPGGGYVFAPVHAIQADVPVENMLAMWQTVSDFGKYQP